MKELDALIAEKVMGMVWWNRGDGYYALLSPDDTAVPYYWTQEKPEVVTDDILTEPLPLYSSEIAAAWEVVERLYDEHWIVGIGSLAENPRGWRCELCNMWPDDFERAPTDIEANGDTAPLAICRAALLAAMERGE